MQTVARRFWVVTLSTGERLRIPVPQRGRPRTYATLRETRAARRRQNRRWHWLRRVLLRSQGVVQPLHLVQDVAQDAIGSRRAPDDDLNDQRGESDDRPDQR